MIKAVEGFKKMIRAERESPVICDTCGKPAVRREVDVLSTYGGRRVVYDTHADSLSEERHLAALGRIDRFHEQVHALEFELRAFFRERRVGFHIVFCEIASMRPTACEVRTQITPRMEIQAFGLRDQIELAARPIEGQTAEQLMEEMVRAAAPVKLNLKARRDSGDY